jgi:hypothetical protein
VQLLAHPLLQVGTRQLAPPEVQQLLGPLQLDLEALRAEQAPQVGGVELVGERLARLLVEALGEDAVDQHRPDRDAQLAQRREPRKDAVDPDTGERYDDVLVIMVEDLSVKEPLLADPSGAFFTTPHFDGYQAVLVRLCHLDRLTMQELSEVITDAWLCRVPKRLAKAYLAERVT